MKPETVKKLHDFIDELEKQYGEIEGFEVSLEHPIIDGQPAGFAEIKQFVIKYITREIIDIK